MRDEVLWGRSNVNFGLNYTDSNADTFTPFPGVGGNTKTKGLNANAGYTYAHGKLTNNFRVTFNRSQINTANFFAGVDNVAGDLGITGHLRESAELGTAQSFLQRLQQPDGCCTARRARQYAAVPGHDHLESWKA